MKKALTAMAAAMLLGGVGYATDAGAQDKKQEHQAKEQSKEQAKQQGQHELNGKVLSVHERTIYLEGEKGEAVPIHVTHETKLNGEPLKKDARIEHKLKQDFKPGEEVRTSFEQHRGSEGSYENRAMSVEKSQGGMEQQPQMEQQPSQMEQPPSMQQQPPMSQ